MSEPGQERSLQVSNMKLTNSLSTDKVDEPLDNLWAICGPPVDCLETSRMVNTQRLLMPAGLSSKVPFY